VTIQDWGSIGEIAGGVAGVLTLAYTGRADAPNTHT